VLLMCQNQVEMVSLSTGSLSVGNPVQGQLRGRRDAGSGGEAVSGGSSTGKGRLRRPGRGAPRAPCLGAPQARVQGDIQGLAIVFGTHDVSVLCGDFVGLKGVALGREDGGEEQGCDG
jgi:hypothetical protein